MEGPKEITKKDILKNITKTEKVCNEIDIHQYSCVLNDDNLYEHKIRLSYPLPNIIELYFRFSKMIDDDSVIPPETPMDVTFLIGQQIITTTKNITTKNITTKNIKEKCTIYDKIMILPDNFYLFDLVKYHEINIDITIYTKNKLDDIQTMLQPTLYYTSFDINREYERGLKTSYLFVFIPDHDLCPMNHPILRDGKIVLGNYMMYAGGMCGMQYIE